MVRKIGLSLPTARREIEVKRAKYILRNEEKHDHDDIVWAQAILHSTPVERINETDPGF